MVLGAGGGLREVARDPACTRPQVLCSSARKLVCGPTGEQTVKRVVSERETVVEHGYRRTVLSGCKREPRDQKLVGEDTVCQLRWRMRERQQSRTDGGVGVGRVHASHGGDARLASPSNSS